MEDEEEKGQEEQKEQINNIKTPKKGIKTSTGLIVIFAAAVLLVGGVLAYWYYTDPNSYLSSIDATQVKSNTNANANINANSNTNANTNSATADWKTYTNDTYGFSFKYPSSLRATDYSSKSAGLFSQTNVVKDASGVTQPNIILGYSGTLNEFVQNEFGSSASFATLLEALQSSTSYLKSKNLSDHKLTIDGETGYWLLLKDAVTVFVQKGDSVYFVTLSTEKTDYSSVSTETKNIISTFQFTK